MSEIENEIAFLDIAKKIQASATIKPDEVDLILSALREKAERNFTITTFHELLNACETVYKEKPEITNFNAYVIDLVEKDLGHKLEADK